MNNPFNDKINKAVAEAARKVMEQTKEAEQIEERAKWRSSSAAERYYDGDTTAHYETGGKSTGALKVKGVKIGDTGGMYDHSSLENRRKAQVVAKTGKTTKASNTSLKGRIRGNLANKQPKPNLPEEVEQMDEKLERDGPVRQNFDKLFARLPHSAAAQKYAERRVQQRNAMNKANDPGADKKGYALSVLDREKAIKKGYEKGVKNPIAQAVVGRKGFKEEVEQVDEQYTLHAVHDEMGTKKKLGTFASKGEAAAHVNKLEKAGRFPDGHEAVLTHNATGEKHMYTDKWEKLDEGRNLFEAEEHVEVKNYPHLHDFVHGSGSANSGESREDSGKIKVKKSHAEKAEEALKKAKAKGMDVHAAGASADDGEDYHEGHKIPSHALRILDKYIYEEVEQVDESKFTASAPISSTSNWRNSASYNNHFRDKKAAEKAAENLKNHTKDGNYHVIPHPDGMIGYRITHAYRRQADVNKTMRNLGPILTREEVEQMDEAAYMGKGNHKPGWMLRADPELAKAFKAAEERIKKRKEMQAKWAGVSIPKSDKMEEETSHIAERLIGRQHKIDANENGKIDAHDFKLLRKKSKMMKESYLAEEATPALSASMKAILADAFHMYFKAHTFHWNVEGANFPEYHKFFGDIYEQLFDTIDPIAEEIRALGDYAPRSLSELKEATSIEDASVQTAAEMFGALLADNNKILAGLSAGYKVAEAAGEIGLSNFLQDKIDAHKKLGWMIKSTAKGA